MTTAAWVRPAVVKEIRGLLPVWVASAITMIGIAILRSAGSWDLPVVLRELTILVLPVAWLGPVAIGAYSIGQEFSHHTLGAFLSQPARRSRLLLVKFAVLVALLAAWAGLQAAASLLHPLPQPDSRPWFAGRPIVVPALYALCVAPWLTMICRSALAGVALTTSIPAVLILSSYPIGRALHLIGYSSGLQGFAFLAAVVWWASVTIAVIGALATLWTIRRLEVADGPWASLRLPSWLVAWNATAMERPVAVADVPRRQSRVWLLLKKEIRVQRLSLLVAGLYVFFTVIWLVAGERAMYVMPHDVFLTIYCGLVAILVGSLASAGERQHGTVEWQILLPTAARWQWALKAGVALGLTAALALGLPAVFGLIEPAIAPGRGLTGTSSLFILFTICGLSVSSLCSNGLRAFVWSLAATVSVGVFVRSVNDVLWTLRISSPNGNIWLPLLTPGQAHAIRYALTHFPNLNPLISLAPAAVLALIFAEANHASSDRGAARVWRQVAWVALCLAIGTAAFFALNLAGIER